MVSHLACQIDERKVHVVLVDLFTSTSKKLMEADMIAHYRGISKLPKQMDALVRCISLEMKVNDQMVVPMLLTFWLPSSKPNSRYTSGTTKGVNIKSPLALLSHSGRGKPPTFRCRL